MGLANVGRIQLFPLPISTSSPVRFRGAHIPTLKTFSDFARLHTHGEGRHFGTVKYSCRVFG